jgi:hypothetical protein
MNGTTATGAGSLLQSQTFWEFAFIVAFVLLIGAHKITIEGMIGGSV